MSIVQSVQGNRNWRQVIFNSLVFFISVDLLNGVCTTKWEATKHKTKIAIGPHSTITHSTRTHTRFITHRGPIAPYQ
jgi:hypothetical protein